MLTFIGKHSRSRNIIPDTASLSHIVVVIKKSGSYQKTDEEQKNDYSLQGCSRFFASLEQIQKNIKKLLA
jgi:translation initiation factor 2B subunit (eIF-2B alpha/beta/delta family)